MKSFLLLTWLIGLGCLAPQVSAQGNPNGPFPPGITVAITSPRNGAHFEPGAPIPIEATAVDSNGGVYRLEFYAGQKRIGISEIFTLVPIRPGEPVDHRVTWTDAPPGRHELRARAPGPEFPTFSPPVTIEVGDIKPLAQVVIVQPADGMELKNQDAVELVAEATDPEGILDVVEFTANGELIGTSRIDFCPPCPDPPFCPMGPCILPPLGVTLTHRVLWERPLAGKYALEARAKRSGSDAVISRPANVAVLRAQKALLTLDSPAEGSVWNTPGVVPIQVTAVDPDGEIRRVEFFANEKPIGISEILTRDVEIPGRPRTHRLNWTNPPAGTQALQAKAVSDAGNDTASEVRNIQVSSGPEMPFIALNEPATGTQFHAGQAISLAATAARPNAGVEFIQFLADGKVIGTVNYCCDVCDCAAAPPDRAFSARFDWKDATPGTHVLTARTLVGINLMLESAPVTVVVGTVEAGISWVAPPEGAVFAQGTPIPLEVQAVDPTGILWVVEFFDGEVRIGSSEFSCLTCRLAPGAVIPHKLAWSGAGVGPHFLTVRATRTDGTVVMSPSRRITVTSDPNPDFFVTRDLPDRYEIDKPFAVQLVVRPDPTVAAYVVEEQPPFALPAPGIPGFQGPFWRVNSISHDGVLDPLTGKVKFGPFFDHQPRTLSYMVVPNVMVQVASFDGVGVADGKESVIGGDRELRGSPRHPADREPADDSISAGELTGYAAAWRREQAWPNGPNPIPVDYVTRAAVLWKGGERYGYDPAVGVPPFCWVSGGGPGPVAGRAAAAAAALAGVALRDVTPQVDGSLRVTLRVMAAPGARAFAIEEHLPAHAIASGITAGGEWSAANHSVRWGPFFTGDAPRVSYTVSGVAVDAKRTGLISFDGQSIPIRDETMGSEVPSDRVVAVDPLHDGSRQVCLAAAPLQQGAEYELQISSDLKQWTSVATFSSGEDAGFARDTGAAETSVRFYRAVRLR